jgi:hypothetical protein
MKVGGKLRSPRAHAAAATQEICDCWEVEWRGIRLLVLPLADGTHLCWMVLNCDRQGAL